MYPDVEQFAKIYAAKQREFWEIQKRFNESNDRFKTADPDDHVFSEQHGLLFRQWIEALRALQDAALAMHEAAINAAGYPADHPLREWLKSRKT